MSKKVIPMPNTKKILDIQKRRLKHCAVDYLCAALFMLLLDAIVLIIALTLDDKDHANQILYFVIPVLSVLFAVFLFIAIKRIMIFHAFNRVRFSNEQVVKIDCKSVRFINHVQSRNLSNVISIIFVDANYKKYTYVLPNGLLDSKGARAEIRQKCAGKTVEFKCYKDTNFIKSCDILS